MARKRLRSRSSQLAGPSTGTLVLVGVLGVVVVGGIVSYAMFSKAASTIPSA